MGIPHGGPGRRGGEGHNEAQGHAPSEGKIMVPQVNFRSQAPGKSDPKLSVWVGERVASAEGRGQGGV